MTRPTSALRTVTTSTPIAEILQILKQDGGVIIKNFLAKAQIDSFNAETRGRWTPLRRDRRTKSS